MKNSQKLLIVLLTISSFGFAQSVSIGSQTWTTKNLDVATFRNGEAIPQAKTEEEWTAAGVNKQASWCYYDYNPKNGVKYGKLYNWYAVNDKRGLAPSGWHVPTYEEWKILEFFLGEDEAAQKMKTLDDWEAVDETMGGVPGNNESGFRALPAGAFAVDQEIETGEFFEIGISTFYWSATKNYSNTWLYYWFGNLQIYEDTDESRLAWGCSVRCLKD